MCKTAKLCGFACLLCAVLFYFQAQAKSQNIHRFDIPVMPLNDALNIISDVSGMSFLVAYDLVASAKSYPLKGSYTTEQALIRLLKGTDLVSEFAQENVFLIRAISTKSPQAVELSSDTQHSGDTATSDIANRTQRSNDEHKAKVERISVVGSYIKRESYNNVGSPIDIVSRAELTQDTANGRLVDTLRFLPMNVGNFSALSPGGDDGAQEGRLGAGTIDLRGLGSGATLVLVNGQRQTSFPLSLDGRVDVTSLMPTIMLERVEVLKDGASAVYGSDAVAGVVNFISRKDFEGFELNLDSRGTLGATVNAFDHHNHTLGLLVGTNRWSPLTVVAGLEYFKQDNLLFGEVEQVPVFTSQGASSFGNPGSYIVPIRDSVGAIIGNQTLADPFCQQVIDQNITQDPNFTQTATSFDEQANLCRITFPNQAFLLEEERWSGRLETKWNITEQTSFQNAVAYTHTIAKDIFNATAPVLNLPQVSGEHPNNPFLAQDINGAQLFAQDSNNDGIADRNANNEVIIDTNGIPFYEDVLFRGRPYSATNLGVVAPKQNLQTWRIESGLYGLIKDWSWRLSANYAKQSLIRLAPDSKFSAFQAALNGTGGPTNNLYFNPFGSAILDPLAANNPVLEDSIKVLLKDKHETHIKTFDGVISGDAYSLPSGFISTAFGFQFRKETLVQDFDELKNIGEVSFFGNGDTDFSASEKVAALFFEVAIPVFDVSSSRLDVSLAGRYESNLASQSRAFNPKFSAHFQSKYFSISGSYANSFLAPSLFQTGGVTAQFANVNDPISGTSEQISTRVIGNKALNDQESNSMSLSLHITPTDNIDVNFSYWDFEFNELVAASMAQTIVSAAPNGPLVHRDASGLINLVERPFFNAGSINTNGIDFKLAYHWLNEAFGDWSVGTHGTYVKDYQVQDSKNGTYTDGVGSDNNGNIGVAMAEWRWNTRLAWHYKKHSAVFTARYYSEVERTRGTNTGLAESSLTVDAKYTYLHSSKWFETHVTIGARNVFNQEPNVVLTTDNQFFIGTYQDPSGRVVFVNLSLVY